jgi:hypothetical protein
MPPTLTSHHLRTQTQTHFPHQNPALLLTHHPAMARC